MWTKSRWSAAVVIVLRGAVEAWASSPCGIYARIDEVVVGPDKDQPSWALIKGDFLLATTSGRSWGPQRGYVCFSLEKADVDRNGAVKGRVPLTGRHKERCLIEWDDLRNLVEEKGKGKAFVAFGSAFSESFPYSPYPWETVEKARQNQVPYPLHHGLTKLRIPAPQEGNPAAKGPEEQNPVHVLQEFQARTDRDTPAKKGGASR
jgi:hypothetical protein